jgi:hypothetical protein
MTTIVNNPAPASAPDSGGSGVLIGVIILMGMVMAFLYFGIPVIKRMSGPIQITIPAPQIVVPGKIDVKVSQ